MTHVVSFIIFEILYLVIYVLPFVILIRIGEGVARMLPHNLDALSTLISIAVIIVANLAW